MDREIIAQLLHRQPDGNKYKYGHVLVVGGSPGMVGAPLLAGKAALRTGAGLVTIAAPADVADKLERRVEEIMTLALPASAAAETIAAFVKDRKVTVLVIGPGMKPEPAKMVLQMLEGVDLPIIIDGGGLGALRNQLDKLDGAISKNVILTPHTGEFERLMDSSLPAKRGDLKPIAINFVKKHRVTLVLKGEPTYVAHPDGSLYENDTGNPGLATAGTGDVLSGVIAGIIAQGIDSEQATEAGAYLHGLAGDIAAADKTEPGMIAGDVIEALPAAFKMLG